MSNIFPCFFSSLLQMAVTKLLSTPPDRNVQIGTSDSICIRTASSVRYCIFSAVSSQLSSWGLLSSFQ